jgi:hypothetical protein
VDAYGSSVTICGEMLSAALSATRLFGTLNGSATKKGVDQTKVVLLNRY